MGYELIHACKKHLKFLLLGILALVIMTLFWLIVGAQSQFVSVVQNRLDGCLQGNQYVEISFEDNKRRSESYISIKVKDNVDGAVVNEIRQSITSASHYHPYEQMKCAIYFSRSFNYDYEKNEPLPNNQTGIWKYNYEGFGEEIIRTAETISGERSDYVSFYQNDFRVSPNELHISLTVSYQGQSDYALIIKDLETRKDVFKLTLTELLEIDEQFVGSFGFLEWTDDGRYFWTSLYDGAYVKGWVRIDTNDWSYEAFPAPPDRTLNGYQLNTESGWVPFMPGGVWTGMDIVEEQVSRDRAERGETLDLYLYNIYTEEEILVADTEATSWVDVGTEWTDDKTLQYKLPSGEKAIFALPN